MAQFVPVGAGTTVVTLAATNDMVVAGRAFMGASPLNGPALVGGLQSEEASASYHNGTGHACMAAAPSAAPVVAPAAIPPLTASAALAAPPPPEPDLSSRAPGGRREVRADASIVKAAPSGLPLSDAERLSPGASAGRAWARDLDIPQRRRSSSFLRRASHIVGKRISRAASLVRRSSAAAGAPNHGTVAVVAVESASSAADTPPESPAADAQVAPSEISAQAAGVGEPAGGQADLAAASAAAASEALAATFEAAACDRNGRGSGARVLWGAPSHDALSTVIIPRVSHVALGLDGGDYDYDVAGDNGVVAADEQPPSGTSGSLLRHETARRDLPSAWLVPGQGPARCNGSAAATSSCSHGWHHDGDGVGFAGAAPPAPDHPWPFDPPWPIGDSPIGDSPIGVLGPSEIGPSVAFDADPKLESHNLFAPVAEQWQEFSGAMVHFGDYGTTSLRELMARSGVASGESWQIISTRLVSFAEETSGALGKVTDPATEVFRNAADNAKALASAMNPVACVPEDRIRASAPDLRGSSYEQPVAPFRARAASSADYPPSDNSGEPDSDGIQE